MLATPVEQHGWSASGAPTAGVISPFFSVDLGDQYLNLVDSTYYRCYDATPDAQVWKQILNKDETVALIAAIPQADWSQADTGASDYIKHKPSLAAVAISGSYLDLSNRPSIPAAQIQSDWSQSTNTAVDYIKNKPTIPSAPSVLTAPTFASVTTAAQLSTTRLAQVIYSFPTSMTSILATQTLTAKIQFADDAAFTLNVVEPSSDTQGCSGLLNLTLSGRLQVGATIPAGKYRRVVLSQTGGATVPVTMSSGQEILLPG